MMSRPESPPSKSVPTPPGRRGRVWIGVPPALWAAVALAVVLAWLAQVLMARAGLDEQAEARNQQVAEQLAARLSTANASLHEVESKLQDVVAGGQFESLSWVDVSGTTVVRTRSPVAAFAAPGWFRQFAPLAPARGRATLWVGARPGELNVQLSLDSALGSLWRAAIAAALAAAGLGALLMAVVGRMRRQLARALARLDRQLHSVGQPGRATDSSSDLDPLLQPIAEAVTRVTEQRATLLSVHAEQMEALRRHAHVDAVTGLPNRRSFVAEAAQVLGEDGGTGGVGLLLLRVRDLYGLNLRLGHRRTDEVLQTMADLLRAFPRQVQGCVLGRLNGSDFGLVLPSAGQALDTAQSLLAAARPLFGPLDPAAGLAVGAAELRRPMVFGDALALVDAALARAEIDGRFAFELVGEFEESRFGGQSQWPQALRRALDEGRIRLIERPLRSADGRLQIKDCPVQLQLDPEGPFEPPSRWLPLATRSRLAADIDEFAIGLALRAIEGDGVGRCISVAAASLATPGFVDRVARVLAASPGSAFRLCIALSEAAAAEQPAVVREASVRWRASGTMLALEHAGEVLARRPHLLDLGIDCVRIDARYVDGASRVDGESVRRYLRALVSLVQGVGLQIAAEGAHSAQDLDVLWSLGFDAACAALPDGAQAGVDVPLEINGTANGTAAAAVQGDREDAGLTTTA